MLFSIPFVTTCRDQSFNLVMITVDRTNILGANIEVINYLKREAKIDDVSVRHGLDSVPVSFVRELETWNCARDQKAE
jgi:hypothetical protein